MSDRQDERDDPTPSLESKIARELKALLDGIAIGDDFEIEPTAAICSMLQFYVPATLAECHPKWKWESLDGVSIAFAEKTGRASVRLGGTCTLITDQTDTPFLFELAASSTDDSIESLQFCVGERGGGALGISGPSCTSTQARKLLMEIPNRIGGIDWSYVATFGLE